MIPEPVPVPLVPPPGTQALLFDCDGTLVDTLGLYRICWRQVFGRHGFEMTDTWFQTWLGHDVYQFVRQAFPDTTDEHRAQIADEGIAMFLDSTHLLEPLDHVVDVARAYHGVLPLAVVSGGLGTAVRESLDAVGITGLFEHVITLDDVEHGKPAPDGYLQAIELLGVAPEHCVAYEDSTTGMAAARAAGIAVIVDVRQHFS